jgi:hypothetical protein
MKPNRNHGNEHTARFLVLLRSANATRALLFGQDQRFLAELLDDDGLLLDDLIRSGTSCQPPDEMASHALACSSMRVQCFALN